MKIKKDAIFHFQNMVTDGSKAWFWSILLHSLVELDINTGECDLVECSGEKPQFIENTWSYRTILKKDEYVYVLPFDSRDVVIIDIKKRTMECHALDLADSNKEYLKIIHAYLYDDYIIAYGSHDYIIRIGLENWSVQIVDHFQVDVSEAFKRSSSFVLFDGDKMELFCNSVHKKVTYNIVTGNIDCQDWSHDLDDRIVYNVVKHNEFYFVVTCIKESVILLKFDSAWKEIGSIILESIPPESDIYELFSYVSSSDRYILLVPAQARGVYSIDYENLVCKTIYYNESRRLRSYGQTHFSMYEYMSGIRVDDKVVVLSPWLQRIAEVDLNGGRITEKDVCVNDYVDKAFHEKTLENDFCKIETQPVCREMDLTHGLPGLISYLTRDIHALK